MSTNTGGPGPTEITLRYDADGDQWIARDETRDLGVRAATREKALEALDEAVASAAAVDDVEVDEDDPFFAAPTFSSGRSDVSRNVDEYLGEYRDEVDPDEDRRTS